MINKNLEISIVKQE